MAEEQQPAISEHDTQPMPAHSPLPGTHVLPPPIPAIVLVAYSGAPSVHLPHPTAQTPSNFIDPLRFTALEGMVNQLAANINTNMAELIGMLRDQNRASSSYTPPPEHRPTVDSNPVFPPIYVTDSEDVSFSATMYVPAIYPVNDSLPPPPAPTAVHLPPTAFLSTDSVMHTLQPLTIPAQPPIYTVPPPTVPLIIGAQAPASTMDHFSFQTPQPQISFSYPASPPLNIPPSELGMPTQVAPAAPPTNIPPEAETEHERRMRRMEETIRAPQPGTSRLDYGGFNWNLFPSMRLPPKIKSPDFKRYNGTKDPRHHLCHYQSKMLQYWDYEEFAIQTFQDSLMGATLDWFMTLKPVDIPPSELGMPTQVALAAPPTNIPPEAETEWERRMRRMEETIRALQPGTSRLDYGGFNWNLFPSMRLPPKIKSPDFKRYNGTKDPRHHLCHYQSKMLQYWDYEEFAIQTFQDSLMGATLDWFMTLKPVDIPPSELGMPTQVALAAPPTNIPPEAETEWERRMRRMEETIRALQPGTSRLDYGGFNWNLFPSMRFCVETPLTLLELSTMAMKENQAFEAYASEWRGKAAKHVPPISEIQQLQLFHSTLKGVYYSHLLSHASSYFELIEAGKKLDMGNKLGRIEGPTKKKEEETPKKHPTGTSKKTKDITTYAHLVHYPPPYQAQQAYHSIPPLVIQPQPPQQHAPVQGRAPASRPVQSVQRTPAPQVQQNNAVPPCQCKQYTPLPASLSHIYWQLIAGNWIRSEAPHPNFDPTKLQEKIQEMIEAKQISFNEVKPPNVRANPLPDHGSSLGPTINMISVGAIGEEEDAQETPVPFVIEYVPAKIAVVSVPFVIQVPTKEPYQNSRVPWNYTGYVAKVSTPFWLTNSNDIISNDPSRNLSRIQKNNLTE
ncbi:hypothetical protein CRG98_022910 [Punica granatum]|uniref:Uncharacterized protein n=1 Tax=Punica granatum TaxID=22663 RepID=A0A2I0JKA2_PUNGR|nr:hypothetical protein CRG98_022910 [Punica granatum]